MWGWEGQVHRKLSFWSLAADWTAQQHGQQVELQQRLTAAVVTRLENRVRWKSGWFIFILFRFVFQEPQSRDSEGRKQLFIYFYSFILNLHCFCSCVHVALLRLRDLFLNEVNTLCNLKTTTVLSWKHSPLNMRPFGSLNLKTNELNTNVKWDRAYSRRASCDLLLGVLQCDGVLVHVIWNHHHLEGETNSWSFCSPAFVVWTFKFFI